MKKGFLLAVILVLLVALPVAAASYSAPVTVTEGGTASYNMLPVVVSIDNQDLADLNIMSSTGLDTRVLQGVTELPHMVVNNTVLFVLPITQGAQYPLEYTFGNDPLTSFPVITGDGGNVTISDHADLELGNNFSIGFEGWVDTTLAGDDIYPAVVGTATSTEDSQVTSHDVSLPSNIVSGDLLLMFFACLDPEFSTPTLTWPGGWTELDTETSGVRSHGIAYRIANGSEESTVVVTTAQTGYSAHQTFRVTDYQGTPSITAKATDNSDNPDSLELTPSWGSSHTLWFSVFCAADQASGPVNTYPTNYVGGQFVTSSAGYASVGSARRELTAASENPGAYDLDDDVVWFAWTIGIQGVGAEILVKNGAFSIYINGEGDLSAKISGIASRVVTVSMSLEEYEVDIWADGTDFGIDIDGITEDSTALGGASVPDNSNNWIISMPYFNCYNHTVGVNHRIRYEPDAMIEGTTLINEENPGTYDGAITWGSNPSGITVEVGALLPVSTSAASAQTTDEGASLVPATGNTTMAATGIEGENLPLYGLFKGLLATFHETGGPDIPMSLFWKMVAVFAGWCFGTAVLLTTRQVVLGFVAYIAGFAVPAFFMGGILDPWIPIVYGISAACLAALLWKWTSSAIS